MTGNRVDVVDETTTTVRLERPGRTSVVRHIKDVVKSMRPKQWTKSGAVFLAFVFSVNQAWIPEDVSTWDGLLARCFLIAVAFSLASGADYLLNDLKDRTADSHHPTKRFRPIAAGRLSPPAVVTWAVGIDICAVALAFQVDWRAGSVIVAYIALMLAYTFALKYEVILDVMVIAAGFVLRAIAGALAIQVPISPWLFVVAGLGALFLAITKRRAEVVILDGAASDHRSTLSSYSTGLLDQMTAVATTSTLVSYSLYTFTGENLPESHAMMATIPFVAFGIFRYLHLSLNRNEGGHPEEVLLKDVPLIITIVGWVITSMIILTLSR